MDDFLTSQALAQSHQTYLPPWPAESERGKNPSLFNYTSQSIKIATKLTLN